MYVVAMSSAGLEMDAGDVTRPDFDRARFASIRRVASFRGPEED